MWNDPPVLPFTEQPEASPGFRENDLILCDFHYGIHVINEFQVKDEDQKPDQHPDKINHAQVIMPDPPKDDLIIYAKN
jgi:hypothetical protein